MASKPKWKKFEELVHKIQCDLAPDSEVCLDEHIDGVLSGTKRQVDICIRRKIGQYEILIAIDCKDLAKPVDVKAVEEVIGLTQDIGANKGAIISASGFTRTALVRGKKAGLDLYRLIDTGNHDWKTHVSIPVLVHIRTLRKYSFTFQATGPLVLSPGDPRLFEVFSETGDSLGRIGEVLHDRWVDEALPVDAGIHSGVDFLGGPVRMRHKGVFYEVIIFANLDIDHSLYFHNLPLKDISGFKDEVKNGVITSEFTTTSIDIAEVETIWQRIESEDELAVRPVITLWMSN